MTGTHVVLFCSVAVLIALLVAASWIWREIYMFFKDKEGDGNGWLADKAKEG